MSRERMLRGILLNHWYHHRGQLTVYLRLLNVPLPAIYGATADEELAADDEAIGVEPFDVECSGVGGASAPSGNVSARLVSGRLSRAVTAVARFRSPARALSSPVVLGLTRRETTCSVVPLAPSLISSVRVPVEPFRGKG